MKRKLIRAFAIILTMAIVIVFSYSLLSTRLCRVAYTPITEKYYVNDFANLLTDEEEDWLVDYAKNFSLENGIDCIIVTIETSKGLMLQYYASILFDAYEFSDKSLLILYSKAENKVCIKVGAEITRYVSDKNGPYYAERSFTPFQKKQDFYNAFRSFQKILMDEISSRIELEMSPFYHETAVTHEVNEAIYFFKYVFYSIFFIIVIILFIAVHGKIKNRINAHKVRA